MKTSCKYKTDKGGGGAKSALEVMPLCGQLLFIICLVTLVFFSFQQLCYMQSYMVIQESCDYDFSVLVSLKAVR